MSISTLQEKLFNKGCGSAIIVIATVALGVSFLSGQCSSATRMNAGAENGREGNVVATVGDVPVTSELVEERASRMRSPDAAGQAMSLAMATGQVLQKAAVRALLDRGPQPMDAEIGKAAESLIAELKDQVRQQGGLKPNASDAEVQAAFTKLTGRGFPTPSEYTTAYKDTARRSAVLDDLGQYVLAAREGAKLYPTEEALKDAFKTYTVRRVFFSAQSGSTEKPEVRAAKALADLKAGTPFDKLMDTVSNDPPARDKKPAHTVTQVLVPGDPLVRPVLDALKDKPVNSTTEAIDVPGGKAIYQLVSVQNNLPPDFAKNADTYRTQRGKAEVDRQVKALLASKDVAWQSAGYHALELYTEAAPYGFLSDPTQAKAAFEAGQAAFKSSKPGEQRLGAMAMMLASAPSPFQVQSSTSVAATPDRIAALEAAKTVGLEDGALDLELAKAYGNRKDGDKAAEALMAASRSNTRYDAAGQKTFGDIAAEALKLQSAKIITADQLKSIQVQQAQWSAARAEDEKANAAAQKANEEEIKRQQAEAAKDKPAPSAKPTPTPSISVQPATTGGAAPKPSSSTGGSLLPTTAGAKP